MASCLRLPPGEQKSKIPVTMTRLCSDGDKKTSSMVETEKKRHLQSDSVDKVGNKPPSRIPLAFGKKKSSADKKRLNKKLKPAEDQKSLGKESGTNFREECRKQCAVKVDSSSPTSAKHLHYWPSKGSNKHITENVQVPRDMKELRDAAPKDTSSPATKDNVTPDFEYNVAQKNADLILPSGNTMSGSDTTDDLGRNSTSSHEREMPNVTPWPREEVGLDQEQKQMDEQKKPRDNNAGSEKTDNVTSEFECNVARKGADLIMSAETYKGVSDLDDDLQRHLTSSDEREMANVSAVKERKEATKYENHVINENKSSIKGNAIMASSLTHIEQFPQEANDEGNEHAISDEEERKMAELDEKSILLTAQFAEENRVAAFPKASQSGVYSADHKTEEIVLSRDESFTGEAHSNKERRQLESEHSEITDEEKTKTPCITANEKLQVSLEENEEKNKVLKEIVNFTNKENEKLLDQVEPQPETVKLEGKFLKANKEYKERELTNVKDDIEKKERQLKDLEDELHYAGMENKYLLYHIDLLEDKLKDSKDSNEDLQFQVFELKLMVKALVKTTACSEKNGQDYGHLREEVELLKGSLDLSRHQEQLLKDQINGLKEDCTIRDKYEQILRTNNKVKGEQDKIIKQMKDQLATLEREHSMMTAEFQKSISNKDLQLNEIQGEKTKITADLGDQLAELKNENSRITAELSDASEKYIQLSNLQGEKANVTMELQKRLAGLEIENSRMIAELSTISEKDKQLNELLKQVEGLKNQNTHFEHKESVAKSQVANKMSSPEESSEDDKVFKTKQKSCKSEIKKLKKRVRQNEREIEHLGRFARQRGFDASDLRIWSNFMTDEREELDYLRNALKLQSERVQQLEDKERGLEKELVQTQDSLRLMAETSEAMNRCVREMGNFLQYADSNSCNSHISSIIDDRDRTDLNANDEVIVIKEDEHEHERMTENSDKDAGHEPLNTFTEHEEMTIDSNKVGGHTEMVMTHALEQAKVELKIKESLLGAAEVKHDQRIGKLDATIKELQSDLEGTQSLLKEKTDALEKAEAQLKLKSSLLASAEAKHDQLMGNVAARERERSVLKEQMENALEDVGSKTKTIQDLEMNLKESRIQVSALESEKRKMEECDRNYKERAAGEIKRLKQALKASNENNMLFGSELRREMQRLKAELLPKDTNKMTQDGGVDVSSRPLMWATLDARAQKVGNKLMRNEIEIDLAIGRRGDIRASQGHGTKRYSGHRSDECFSLQRLESINQATGLSARDETASDWISLSAADEMSIFNLAYN